MENAKIFRTSFGEVYGASESHLFLAKKITWLAKVERISIVHDKDYVFVVAPTENGEVLKEKICFSDSKDLEWYHNKDLEEFASFLQKEGKEVIFWNEKV
jgi:hypothetical protein